MERMRIQTLTWQTLARVGQPRFEHDTGTTDAIVAPEGSELAGRLRSTGWVARSGWRTNTPGRPPVWLVRFERPDPVSVE
jgi:hypothetical protein